MAGSAHPAVKLVIYDKTFRQAPARGVPTPRRHDRIIPFFLGEILLAAPRCTSHCFAL